MKQIKINKLSLPDKESVFTDRQFYWVNLGNGVKRKFRNKKEALAFLAEVSRLLTYKLHETNELYISLFTYYRRAWFYFDHNPGAGRHAYADWYKMERICRNNIETIENMFDVIYRRHQGENGNYFVFNNFYTIFDAMQKVIANLYALYEPKGMAGVLYELEILNKKVAYCRRTIENYTIEVENEFKTVEAIELTLMKTGTE